jgi:hypothetical protein
MMGGRKKEKEKGGGRKRGDMETQGWVRVTKGVAVADVESEGMVNWLEWRSKAPSKGVLQLQLDKDQRSLPV